MKNQYRKMRLFVIIFLGLSLISTLHSQAKKGMYGITTTISKGFGTSQNISTNTGSLNIGMAYMPSDQLNLRGELGFRSQSDTSGRNSSEFTFTASLWYYLQNAESLSTFIGGSLGFGSASDISGNATSLVDLGAFFGAEYWFSQHFSCFGHIGITYANYKVLSKPATDTFTSAETGLTWYL